VGRVVGRSAIVAFAMLAGAVGTVALVGAVDGWPERPVDERSFLVPAVCGVVGLVLLVVYVAITIAPHADPLLFEGNAYAAGAVDGREVEVLQRKAGRFHQHQTNPVSNTTENGGPRRGSGTAASANDHASADSSSRAAADFYRDMALEPSLRTPRISEFFEPHRASQIVRTTLTVAAPDGFSGQLIVPVFRVTRGTVLTGLRLYGPDGERVSSLGQADSLAYAFAVVRTMLSELPSALDEYCRVIEPLLMKHVLNAAQGGEPNDEAVITLLEAVENLTGVERKLSEAIAQYVTAHLQYNFVCVVVDAPAVAADPVPRTFRLAVERAEPKEAATRQLIGKELGWVARVVLLWLPALRRFAGVETTIYQYPLELAALTRSYHLEIAGPRGTYLAKQAVQPAAGKELTPAAGTSIVLTPRTGQRFSHTYIRNSATDFRGVSVANTFYERPPGAVLLAWLSAAAAWVIVLLCALKALLRPEVNEPHADLVAVLLAFPPGIALWAGVGESVRQTLSAYAFRLTTVFASAFAAYLYVLGPPVHEAQEVWWHDPASWWTLVMSILTVTLLGSGASLTTRLLTSGRVQKSST
jgi:hypothetical protein